MDFFPANAMVFAQRVRAEDLQELIESLANGNPIAWTVVIGIVAVLVLAPVTAACWRRCQKKPDLADPAQIIAAWQKQRGLCFLALVVAVAGFCLGAFVCLALDNTAGGVLFVSFVLAGMFISLVMLIVNARCPACGASVGRDWTPTFCSKCGVPLKEIGQTGLGTKHRPAKPDQGVNADEQKKLD